MAAAPGLLVLNQATEVNHHRRTFDWRSSFGSRPREAVLGADFGKLRGKCKIKRWPESLQREPRARRTFMTAAPFINSYYTATANRWAPAPPLAGAVSCDVCVVGGGITGCSAALHLAERGYDVVLLEAQSIGWGASGRSGAQVIVGFAREIDRIAAAVGAADARRLWDMSREAVDLVKAQITRHAINCDWQDGQIHVALKARQRDELRNYQQLLAVHYDYPLQFIEGADLRAVLASPRYCAGAFDRRSGHLHPLNYTLGLAEAARAAGVRVYEHSKVERFDATPTPQVRTQNGSVNARHLVFAGNAYLDRLVPTLARKIIPVGTYIVASEPLGATRARELIANNMAVTDINFVLDYYRLSADHRMLFGGRVSYTAHTPRN